MRNTHGLNDSGSVELSPKKYKKKEEKVSQVLDIEKDKKKNFSLFKKAMSQWSVTICLSSGMTDVFGSEFA